MSINGGTAENCRYDQVVVSPGGAGPEAAASQLVPLMQYAFCAGAILFVALYLDPKFAPKPPSPVVRNVGNTRGLDVCAPRVLYNTP